MAADAGRSTKSLHGPSDCAHSLPAQPPSSNERAEPNGRYGAGLWGAKKIIIPMRGFVILFVIIVSLAVGGGLSVFVLSLPLIPRILKGSRPRMVLSSMVAFQTRYSRAGK